MNITYGKGEACVCFNELVENPLDRSCIKRFTRVFNSDIVKASIRLHERFIAAETAADYNKMYGSGQNRIEIKEGVKNKDNLVLKVRITDAYRKFFYSVENTGEGMIIKENWAGQFADIRNIHVFDINKHEYKK
ncbi:hypothetical protein Barb6_00146 [Bacteroidales bacterium Barb6]|nr:hypothetical protein Barb6XT_02970 [Bacteroidales bacterium Barb6XT]OAV73508.1 hypothetical protein Barb6_00175 [Bacteroidales bacterium Barb6]OAV73541.1 hypothetical protein Barb6_00146 [Bacteroidales bacterium Barb6]